VTARAARASSSSRRDVTAEVAFLTRALKAPTLREAVPRLVERAMNGEIDVEPFISHRIALDEVNRGFELMGAQDGIRSVIEFG